MADSYHIRGDQVVPYSGGRLNTCTDSWRDATDLELQQEAEIERLEARVTELEAMVLELADDLEDEIKATCCDDHGGIVYPAYQWRYDRDMDVVIRAREALEGK